MTRRGAASKRPNYKPTFTVEQLLPLQGKSAAEQSAILGCSVATVFALRKEAGLPKQRDGRRPTLTVADLLPVIYEDRLSQAAALGCHHSVVDRLRREARAQGYILKVRRADPKWDMSLLDGLEHLNNVEAAKVIGCSSSWVRVYRKRHGKK